MNSRRYCFSGISVIAPVLALIGLFIVLHAEHVRAAYKVHYVAPGGACGGQTPCYATLQAAVDAAGAGDQIRLAGGVYTNVNNYAGLAQVAYISKTVTLRGGYSTEDWERSFPLTQPTVLDAQQAGRVLYISGHISSTIENLSLVNGDATGLGGNPRFSGYSVGGALHSLSATISASNTIWSKNLAQIGSAIYIENGHFTLLHSTIISNVTATLGGGLFQAESESVLVDNVIANNAADYGGGLAVYGGRAELIGNRIVSNHSVYHGGGVLYVYADGLIMDNVITGNVGLSGGGASLSGNILVLDNTISQNSGDFGAGIVLNEGHMSLINNTITENRSSLVGGGVAINYFSTSLDPDQKIVSNNIISGNQAEWGGGLFLEFVRPMLVHNLIRGNVARERGGGLFLSMSQVSLDGDMIMGNTAAWVGGGLAGFQSSLATLRNIVLSENWAGSGGSALFVEETSVDLSHATIVNNSGSSGIYASSGPNYNYLTSSIVTMTNAIMVSHTIGITAAEFSTVTINGMLWFGNGVNTSGPGKYIISNTVEGDPAFASDGYHLGPASTALDNGVPSGLHYDIDWEPRPYKEFDLGADEFWPEGILQRMYLPLISRLGH